MFRNISLFGAARIVTPYHAEAENVSTANEFLCINHLSTLIRVAFCLES